MTDHDTLVSVALPVRNGAARLEGAVRSVLAQDHENLQLVISDNASTDATEECCRDLAASDRRITYHRHPRNVGLLNNFVHAGRLAGGRSCAGSATTTGWRPPASPARCGSSPRTSASSWSPRRWPTPARTG